MRLSEIARLVDRTAHKRSEFIGHFLINGGRYQIVRRMDLSDSDCRYGIGNMDNLTWFTTGSSPERVCEALVVNHKQNWVRDQFNIPNTFMSGGHFSSSVRMSLMADQDFGIMVVIDHDKVWYFRFIDDQIEHPIRYDEFVDLTGIRHHHGRFVGSDMDWLVGFTDHGLHPSLPQIETRKIQRALRQINRYDPICTWLGFV